MVNQRLNDTCWSLVRCLALQVRMLTLDQVTRGWFGAAAANGEAEEWLTVLIRASFVERRRVEAHPVVRLDRPLLSWRPGLPSPKTKVFEEIAQTSRARWTLPEVPTDVFIASKRAVRLFGAFSDSRRIKECEVTHDLHLSEVFVSYRNSAPQMASSWWGEAAFPKLGFVISRMKDPDAFVLSATGQATRIIEVCGIYEPEHLVGFHQHCAGTAAARIKDRLGNSAGMLSRLYSPKGTGYELW